LAGRFGENSVSDAWDELHRRKKPASARERTARGQRATGRSSWDAHRSGQQGARRGEGRLRHRRRRGEPELTPEEQAYREARLNAERKIKFVQHFVTYFFVCFFLFFVAGRVAATIVGLAWGIGLASHFFQAIIAPDLRRKWVGTEVDQQVARSVTRERRALEGENLRSLEELSASIAHEIRNPITAAKSLVQQLGEDPGSPDNVEYAQVALQELDRVERSISHLLRYAREEAMDVREIQLADVLDSALDTLRDRIEGAGVKLTLELDSEGSMEGDPEKLRRVLINLVGNALDAFDEVGQHDPNIDVALGENLAGTEVWIRIKDNGGGMDPETQKKIFRPFYTSKSNGTGLGLAVTRKLVDAHRGTVELHSTPGSGTEFVLTFPKQTGAEVSS
jgi:signal transduction histidine kinase